MHAILCLGFEQLVTEAEELEQGIDRQTMAFREMLNDAGKACLPQVQWSILLYDTRI
jgi:hypothetical protein